MTDICPSREDAQPHIFDVDGRCKLCYASRTKPSLKVITAKFNGTCFETGRPIKKGDTIVYDYTTKRTYASGSPTQQKLITQQRKDRDQGGDMLDESIEQWHESWYSRTYNQ